MASQSAGGRCRSVWLWRFLRAQVLSNLAVTLADAPTGERPRSDCLWRYRIAHRKPGYGAGNYREDDGTLLSAEALAGGGEGFVAWDEGCGGALRYDPARQQYESPPMRLALFGSFAVRGHDGPIACRPAFAM
jgi:hypothetical protein